MFMAEQRFLRNPQSAAAHVPVSNPSRTGIQINWNEEAIETIKIRHHPIEMAVQAQFIYLKPSRWQGHAAQFALDAPDQKIFASSQGRPAT
jgi:hypothetical protein